MIRTGSALGLLLLGALACGAPAKRTPLGPPPVLEVEGCQEVRGEVCVLRLERRLTLWVGPVAGADPEPLRADGRTLSSESATPVQGGWRIEVVVPDGTRRLEIADQSVQLEASGWPRWMFEAQGRIRTGDFAGARELLGSCAVVELDERSRPACWTLLAKALPPSRERDEALVAALAGHRAAGHRLGEVDALTLAIGAALERGDGAAVEDLLAGLPPAPRPARAELLVAYWEGLVARRRGDVARALERLTQAALQADRLGRTDDLRSAEVVRALTLEEMGRFQSAAEIFGRLTERALPATPCERAELWSNVGWTRYLAHEQGDPVEDPAAALERAAAELPKGPCPQGRHFNVHVNRAVALLQAGRIAEVAAALADADRYRAEANAEQRWWFALAEANLALARGERELALGRFDQLALLEVPEAQWRARLGRALALGETPAAFDELAAVEALLDDRLARLPAREGREWFIAQSETVVRRRLVLLLARGDPAAALVQVRRARARVLRGFTAPSPGPPAKLAEPGPGELLLAYHPLDRETWLALAAEPGRPPRAVRIPAPPAAPVPSPELAALLLGPFHEEIARARRLRVMPYGRLRELDFHALPHGGEPLLASRPVTYGLDLPARQRLRGGGKALVIGNPGGDLQQAESEAIEVVELLRRSGRDVKLLMGLDAGADEVRRHLAEGVELLHFAGHADFSGPGGWQSELRLARGTRLRLEDLLALEQAPDWVVLSACESGKTTTLARVDGLGLAQTFLLAGARAVVATSRPIADDVARPLVVELYRAWLGGADLASALARAETELHGQPHAGDDWAAFRVLEP
jgi:tetratricopeptide (TPR) repeat protein